MNGLDHGKQHSECLSTMIIFNSQQFIRIFRTESRFVSLLKITYDRSTALPFNIAIRHSFIYQQADVVLRKKI